MYKPITHRVKRAPLKQTTPKAETSTTASEKGPDKEYKETRNKTWDDLRKEGWSEAKIKEAKEWRANNPDAPNVGVTETKTKEGEDINVTVTKPLYTQDYGDSLYAPQQRGVERGLLQSARKTGKFARKAWNDMTKAEREATGYKSRRDYVKSERGAARKAALEAQKEFATTQREMASQGIAPGSRGRGKVSTLKGKDFGREMSMSEVGMAKQEEINAQNAKREAQQEVERLEKANQRMANKISTVQTETAGLKQLEVNNALVTPTASEIQANIMRDINSPKMKTKSPYKMGGYGSKAYKK